MRFYIFSILVGLPFIYAREINHSSRCGVINGLSCLDSPYGPCCSQYNWWYVTLFQYFTFHLLMAVSGKTDLYCNAGCQSAYGICDEPPSSTSSHPPAPTQQVSTNERCGWDYGASPGGMTCLGAMEYGECCSQLGYCGRSVLHCGIGCQAGFGKCDFVLLPPLPSSETSPPVFTISLKWTSRTTPTSSFSSTRSSSNIVSSSVSASSSISIASSLAVTSSILSSFIGSTSSAINKLPSQSGVSSSDSLPPASLSSLSGATYCRSRCQLSVILCVVSWVLAAIVLVGWMNDWFSLSALRGTRPNAYMVANTKEA